MKKYFLIVLIFSLLFGGKVIAQTQSNAIATTGPVGIDITTSLTAPLTVNSPNTTYIVIGNPTVTGYSSLNIGLSAKQMVMQPYRPFKQMVRHPY
jgi:CRISPR/Cas system type I-B associated protein Csh2 (Cas7 group RAMP superfamily)